MNDDYTSNEISNISINIIWSLWL